MQFRRSIALAALMIAVGAIQTSRVEAQVCAEPSPGADEDVAAGHAAGAVGGGLFGGLVLAVLHLKHQRDAASSLAPNAVPIAGAGTPAVAPNVTVSAGVLDPVPAPAAARSGARPNARVAARPAAARMPLLSSREAQREGLVPPKTATIFPALAMIGLGSLLLGLFLLRERARSRRHRWR
jgi:hypothetical protein